jgi:nitroreductase
MTALTPDQVLTTTRSVRKRLDLTRPVPLELIRECLEIALQAPSGSNQQHWEWLVITDPDQRAAIGEYYRRAFQRYRDSPGYVGKQQSDDAERNALQARIGDSSEYLAAHMGEVPVLLIPCITASGDTLPAANQAGLWGSILPATWSYMLAARARGLGTAWTSLHLQFETEVAGILNLPTGIRQAALIPTAYFTGDTFKPASRQPLDTVLHLDRW